MARPRTFSSAIVTEIMQIWAIKPLNAASLPHIIRAAFTGPA